MPSLSLGEGCGVIEFGAGLPASPVAQSVVAQTPVPAPNHWSETDIDDRYARLDRQFATGVLADLPATRTHVTTPIPSTPSASTALSRDDDIEQGLLHEVESISAVIRSAEPPRPTAEPTSEFPSRSEPPALATSPWCTGWSEMPEWDVVQPEWVVETPAAAPAMPAPAPAASETHEAAWETHPAPFAPSPPHVEPPESHPAPETLSFEAHQVLPSLNTAVESPPPVASVRIDQPAARPYSRLFSRLRRLRAG
jgi:hypothetical protein